MITIVVPVPPDAMPWMGPKPTPQQAAGGTMGEGLRGRSALLRGRRNICIARMRIRGGFIN